MHDDALNLHYVECIEEGVVDLLELLLGDEGAGVDPKPYLDEIAANSEVPCSQWSKRLIVNSRDRPW